MDCGYKNRAFLAIADSGENIQIVDVLSICKSKSIVLNNKNKNTHDNLETDVFEITCAKGNKELLLSLAALTETEKNESMCLDGNTANVNLKHPKEKKKKCHSESSLEEFMCNEQHSQSCSKDLKTAPVIEPDDIAPSPKKKRKKEQCLKNQSQKVTLPFSNIEKLKKIAQEGTSVPDPDFYIEQKNDVDSFSTGNAFPTNKFSAWIEQSHIVEGDNEDSYTQRDQQDQIHLESISTVETSFSKISFHGKKRKRQKISKNRYFAPSASIKLFEQNDHIEIPLDENNLNGERICTITKVKKKHIIQGIIKCSKKKSKKLTQEYQLPNSSNNGIMPRNSRGINSSTAIGKEKKIKHLLSSIDSDDNLSPHFVHMDQTNSVNQDIYLCVNTEDGKSTVSSGSLLPDVQSDLAIHSQRLPFQRLSQFLTVSDSEKSNDTLFDESDIKHLSELNIYGNSNNIVKENQVKHIASKQQKSKMSSETLEDQLKESSENIIRTYDFFSEEINPGIAGTSAIAYNSEINMHMNISEEEYFHPGQNFRNVLFDSCPISNLNDNKQFETNCSTFSNENEVLQLSHTSLADYDDCSDIQCLEMQSLAEKNSCEKIEEIKISDDDDDDCEASKWYYMSNQHSKSNSEESRGVEYFLSKLDFSEDPVNFLIPTLHEKETIHQIKVEERKKMLKMGIEIYLGKWRFEEVETLKKNWNNFMTRNDIKDRVLFYSAVFCRQKCGKFQHFLKKKHFWVRLAQDINERTLYGVYRKASLLFHPKRTDKMTHREIKQLKKQYGKEKPFISELNENASEECKFDHIRNNYNSGRWSKEETGHLKEAVGYLVGPENLTSITSLSDLPWGYISEFVGTRSGRQCFLKAKSTNVWNARI